MPKDKQVSKSTKEDSPKSEKSSDRKNGIRQNVNDDLKGLWSENKASIMKWGYISEGVIGIICTMIWIVLINLFYNDLSFLTEDFDVILVLINVSAVLTVLLHFGLIIMHTKWYKALSHIINNIFGFFIILLSWRIFPFDFEDKYSFIEDLLPFLFVLTLVGLVIGSLVEIGKLSQAMVGMFTGKTKEK